MAAPQLKPVSGVTYGRSGPAPFAHALADDDGAFSALRELVAQLDRAVEMPLAQLPETVAQVLACCTPAHNLLSDAQCEGSPERYTRHVLHSDAAGRYTLVALIWHPGQRTPAHGHHTWCAYSVLEGSLHEERFSWDSERRVAHPDGIVILTAGQALSAQAGLGKIHRLGNRTNERAISLHVYGVDAEQVSTHVNHVVTV